MSDQEGFKIQDSLSPKSLDLLTLHRVVDRRDELGLYGGSGESLLRKPLPAKVREREREFKQDTRKLSIRIVVTGRFTIVSRKRSLLSEICGLKRQASY